MKTHLRYGRLKRERAMSEASDLGIQPMDAYNEATRELVALTTPGMVQEGERDLLVVGIHAGVAPGPNVRDVNTAAVLVERIGTLEDGKPIAPMQPQDRTEFILGALRGAEEEGEQGRENTAIFWLVRLSPRGKPDTSSVRRWTYRAIGAPDARISYHGHDIPTRDLRTAIKEHARNLKDIKRFGELY
jgi:hypothetical protein